MVKACTKCGLTKPLDAFGRQKKGKQGHTARCKACDSEYHREWYAKNRERILERQREYILKRGSPPLEVERKSRLMRLYGLSLASYRIMQLRQCNHCAVCRKWMGDDVVVDHCHNTGKVRGLLHRKCNAALGIFQDDAAITQNATDYLRGSVGA